MMRIRKAHQSRLKKSVMIIEMKWDQFGQTHYVKSVKCIWYEGLYNSPEEAALGGARVERSRDLEILAFDPLAQVQAFDFELLGLDLPEGTQVRDRDTGETSYVRREAEPQ